MKMIKQRITIKMKCNYIYYIIDKNLTVLFNNYKKESKVNNLNFKRKLTTLN